MILIVPVAGSGIIVIDCPGAVASGVAATGRDAACALSAGFVLAGTSPSVCPNDAAASCRARHNGSTQGWLLESAPGGAGSFSGCVRMIGILRSIASSTIVAFG